VAVRFYAPAAGEPGQRVVLPEEEAAHLVRVLRMRRGDVIHVLNGRGGLFEAVVAEAGREEVVVVLGAARPAAPEPRVAVTLAMAVLKGDRMDDVVRDAVMLGVAAIQPLVTSRTEVDPAALGRAKRTGRWRRVAVSSMKQCGRGYVPPVFEPITVEALQSNLAAATPSRPVILLLEPGAGPAHRLRDLPAAPPPAATLIVGPEGGWSATEREVLAAHAESITLGPRTLRADATPLVALSALFTHWHEF
jgi:16S rRNA (uracil1498-N3)-methyltransferase